MTLEIKADKNGKPFLKMVDRPRLLSKDGRGIWVEVGRVGQTGVEEIVRRNREQGHLVLQDELGFYRSLILTD